MGNHSSPIVEILIRSSTVSVVRLPRTFKDDLNGAGRLSAAGNAVVDNLCPLKDDVGAQWRLVTTFVIFTNSITDALRDNFSRSGFQ